MIYYNRGVDLLTQKRFPDAADANAKALRLDPRNATARGNLLATINNWSIALGNMRRFAEAAALLREGLAIDAKFAPFSQNYSHVCRRWSEELCSENRLSEALQVLSQAAAEMPESDSLRRARMAILARGPQSATPRLDMSLLAPSESLALPTN
jgi:tetratricopeptide (TPR) repeat protein